MHVNEVLKVGTIKEGSNPVPTEDGKATFNFVSKGGQVIAVTAQDHAGNSLPVTTKREKAEGSGGVECWVCIRYPAGETCYPVDCKNLPQPINKPADPL